MKKAKPFTMPLRTQTGSIVISSKKFKGMFQRIFVTGVSPVTLNDVTSGFNIGWNISVKETEYNEMLGFSTEDVRVMFNYYKEIGKMPAGCDVESMINEMKPWYDNYCFAEGSLKNKTASSIATWCSTSCVTS